MNQWKAYRKGGDAGEWELYDLSQDVSETTNLAAKQPAVLTEMKTFAAEAHRPMPKGEIYDRALVEKDRAYWEGLNQKKAKKKRVADN
jgi:arylsulfatase A-like enzyme